jgi:hypothetical protein
VATDGRQWILQRLRGTQWAGISFVRSTRDILARCMTEKGVPSETAKQLLAVLPPTFDQSQHRPEMPLELYESRFHRPEGIKPHPAAFGVTQPSSRMM